MFIVTDEHVFIGLPRFRRRQAEIISNGHRFL